MRHGTLAEKVKIACGSAPYAAGVPHSDRGHFVANFAFFTASPPFQRDSRRGSFDLF
jgi:hypothetical protein